jgi:hypothetical protein
MTNGIGMHGGGQGKENNSRIVVNALSIALCDVPTIRGLLTSIIEFETSALPLQYQKTSWYSA